MIKFYSSNLLDQALLTPSSQNLLFPVTNLNHPFRTKVFRSTSNTSNLVMDFGETSEMDSILVVDDPRNGFGVSTITLELNTVNTWTTPAFSQVLTMNTYQGLAYAEFPLKTYRYARLVMTSTLGYCELSKFFIGKAIGFESGMGIDLGWNFADKELSTVKENRYGQKFVDVVARQRQMSFSINTMTKDELDQVFEVYDSKGITEPFFVRIGTDGMINDKDRFAGMFYLNSIPSITNKAFGLYDISMTLEEAM